MTERNAIAGAISSAITALALFVVYRVAFQYLGGPALGAWALLSGLMTLARVGEAGVGLGLLRLVAIDIRASGRVDISKYMLAGVIIASLPTALTAALGGIVGFLYLRAGHASQVDVRDLWVLSTSAWLFAVFNSVGSVMSGCIDGAGRMFYRITSYTASTIVLAGLVWLLTPRLGVVGFGLANVGFAVLFCLVLFVIGSRLPLPEAHQRPNVVSLMKRAKNVVLGGLAIGACRAAFDPLCKFLVGAFGDLAAVAIFDFANRISLQLRSVFASGVQALSPSVARAEDEHVEASGVAFADWWSLTYLLSGLASLGSIAVAPVISELIFRRIEPTFLTFTAILAFGGWINSAGLVGFYVEMGQGRMNALMLMHIVMVVINVLLGLCLGELLGPEGVAAAWAVALAYGGVFLLYRSSWKLPGVRSRRGVTLTLMIVNWKALGIFSAGCLLAFGSFKLASEGPTTVLAATSAVAIALGAAFVYEAWNGISRLRRSP